MPHGGVRGAAERRTATLQDGRAIEPKPAKLSSEARPASPHVLLLDAANRAADLRCRLRANVRLTAVRAQSLYEVRQVDVAILDFENVGLACSPLLRDPALGFPELVFLVDAVGSAQDLALRSHGFRHLVGENEILEWLPAALDQLVALTRARRILLQACADCCVTGQLRVMPRTKGMGLHAAETSFRSAFIRGLLAESGSRRRAAEQAGVPYRSFCEMLRKLGL